MARPTLRLLALAAFTLCHGLQAHAADAAAPDTESSSVPPQAQDANDSMGTATKKALAATGLQFWGYMRAGAYYARNGQPKGGYRAGDLGFSRLGNEGDQFLEFGIGKKWKLSGASLGTYWMPYLYNSQGSSDSGTKQVYTDITGLSFAPELSFWAGQRYHRIQDLHIIDNWLMEDGDNFGAGIDGFKLGSTGGTLNLAVYTEGNTDNSTTTSNAKRANVQLRELPVGPGGTLNLTAGIVRGSFDDKKTSLALGALYNQKFGSATNSLFIQGSNGHADLRGKFYALNGTTTTTVGSPFICTVTPNPDGSCPTSGLAANPNTVTSTTYNPGARQFRILNAVNWQSGLVGGQAFVGYQTLKPEDTGLTTKNLGVGGRVSYGIAPNVKLYGDAIIGSVKTDGAATQRLDKETVAIAVAPNTDFWSRPEVRLYVTRVGGNDAVKAAGTFGDRSSAFLAGVQVEAWWE